MLNEKQKKSLKAISKADVIVQGVVVLSAFIAIIAGIIFSWYLTLRDYGWHTFGLPHMVSTIFTFVGGGLMLAGAYKLYHGYKILRYSEASVDDIGLSSSERISDFIHDVSSTYMEGAIEMIGKGDGRAKSSTNSKVAVMNKITAAREMIADGLTTEAISRYTGLSSEEVDSLRETRQG